MAAIILAAINAKWIHPSLALRLLKANLGELEADCEIMEFALRQPLSEKTGPLTAARPRILGLSVSVWNHEATLELLEALEGTWETGPVVVLGGPEVSFLPKDAKIFGHADYVVRGEGEDVFRELCRFLLHRGKAGVNLPFGRVNEKSDKFIDAPEANLQALKTAYHLYHGEDLRRKLVYVEASRGCPFGCEFCLSAAGGSAGRVREFPLEQFLANMDQLLRRGAGTIKFLDRTFNLDITRAVTILEFFLDRMREGLCVHFEMVPSNFPAELRDCLRRFPPGSLRLEIGIQTLNAQTAALIHRCGGEGLEILSFLRRETSAIVHVDLIAGLPGEDMDSFGRGFDRVWAALSSAAPGDENAPNVPAEIQLGILKLLPGAPIARHTESCGMVYSKLPPYEVMETAAMSRNDLDRIKNFARFWELIVNRGGFPGLAPRFFPPRRPVFRSFMDLAGRLLFIFKRNWGIDKRELRRVLEELQG
jgi:radical SAM superfamily enzyme YgiQ (UPF0313 family)